jgi:multicomponent Na+:H+ antiporter subunit D
MLNFPPAWILLLGALLVPYFTGRARSWYTIILPTVTLFTVVGLEPGSSWHVHFFGFDLTLLRVDKLSRLFGIIFTLFAAVTSIYSYYMRDAKQHVSGLLYMGSALGVIFSGDLISLYFYWEIMAVTSVMLILARRTTESYLAGCRYVLVHIFGGLCLLAGILMHISATGSVEFTAFTTQNAATWLILVGILVNAAVPPLSAWLTDAYPAATVTGTVILSAFTTKTAVYTLIRGFPGWEILVVLGCIMALYGIIYAFMENDIRRILAYAIINQSGFKIAGVGVGSAMALNGAAINSFAHIMYMGLLFMAAGAVLHMTGRSKCTELGGLFKSMPVTLILGAVGALAISAFPLTSGFTTKSLIIEGTASAHLFWAWLALEVASAGVVLHAGLKFPYFTFFARDRGLRPGETNKSMLTAMGILAFLTIFLGVYPDPLYSLLPYPMPDYQVYTIPHVVTQLQLLLFAALLFFLLLPLLKPTRTISLDTDWFYRKGGNWVYSLLDRTLNGLTDWSETWLLRLVRATAVFFQNAQARLTLFIMVNIWLVQGIRGKRLQLKKHKLYSDITEGALPVGLGAAVSTAFIALVFLIS